MGKANRLEPIAIVGGEALNVDAKTTITLEPWGYRVFVLDAPGR